MTQRNLVSYAVLALVWGLSFMVLVRVVPAFGWAGTVSLRAFTAGFALWGLALLLRRRLDFSCGWRPLAVSGLLTVVMQLGGIAYAAPKIGTAMAAIIVSTIPLFSMVVGRLAGFERLNGRSIAGLFMGFAGIVMLVGFPNHALTPEFLFNCAVTIAGSFAAACGSLYVSTRLKGTDPWVVTIGSFLAGGTMTLPLLLFFPLPRVPGPADFLWLGTLGFVTSALMYVLYFGLLRAIGATRAVSVEFAVTVVAVTAGTTLLGERLTAMQIAGAAVIIAGCSLVLGLWAGLRRRVTS